MLLITGFFGIVKIISCGFFLLFLVERIGRRGGLLGGAALMGMYMLIIAVLTATHPPAANNKGFTPTGAASVAMIYLEASMYALLLDPLSRTSTHLNSVVQLLMGPDLLGVHWRDLPDSHP